MTQRVYTLDADTAETLEALGVWLCEDPADLLAEALELHATRCWALGSPLTLAIARRGLNQSELARRVGVSRSAITHVVAGRLSPSADLAQRIADELAMPPQQLEALLDHAATTHEENTTNE